MGVQVLSQRLSMFDSVRCNVYYILPFSPGSSHFFNVEKLGINGPGDKARCHCTVFFKPVANVQ